MLGELKSWISHKGNVFKCIALFNKRYIMYGKKMTLTISHSDNPINFCLLFEMAIYGLCGCIKINWACIISVGIGHNRYKMYSSRLHSGKFKEYINCEFENVVRIFVNFRNSLIESFSKISTGRDCV
jgi:hypothetical protein